MNKLPKRPNRADLDRVTKTSDCLVRIAEDPHFRALWVMRLAELCGERDPHECLIEELAEVSNTRHTVTRAEVEQILAIVMDGGFWDDNEKRRREKNSHYKGEPWGPRMPEIKMGAIMIARQINLGSLSVKKAHVALLDYYDHYLKRQEKKNEG